MNKITIFSNGIADFQRVFKVGKNEHSDVLIRVRRDHIGDLLSSINVYGGVKLTKPPSFLHQQEERLQFDSCDVFKSLGGMLKGGQIIVRVKDDLKGGQTIKEDNLSFEGILLGVNKQDISTGGEAVHKFFYCISTADGKIKQIPFDQIEELTFPGEGGEQINKCVENAFQKNIKPDSDSVCLQVYGEEEGQFTVQYTVPVPAWKMTYRLVKNNDSCFLDGVCVVDNNTEEDWDNFLISVVEGSPITFATDIAESKVPSRSTVNIVREQAAGAVEAPKGYGGKEQVGGPVVRAMGMAACSMERSTSHESSALQADVATQEVGDFSVFESNTPLTIRSGESASIPVFNKVLDEAKTVLYYNSLDNDEQPFRTIQFKNETGHNLGRGVCTVYEEGVYSGSAVFPPTKKKENILLCHAVETGVRVFRNPGNVHSTLLEVKVADGVGHLKHTCTKETQYILKNIKEEQFSCVLDHDCHWPSPREVRGEVEGKEILPSENFQQGVRFNLNVEAENELVFNVKEEEVELQEVKVDSLLRLHLNSSHPLLEQEDVQKCVELQRELEQKQKELRTLNDSKNEAIAKQDRVLKIIEADSGSQEWRQDLRETEDKVRRISEEEEPKIRDEIENLQTKLQKQLEELSVSWKNFEHKNLEED